MTLATAGTGGSGPRAWTRTSGSEWRRRTSSTSPYTISRPRLIIAIAVAQRLDLIHLMGREDRRAPVAPAFEQQVLHEPDVDRIEPRCRLVEHAQLGIAQQHGGDLDLLRHALAQPVDLPSRDVRQLDALEPLAPIAGAPRRGSSP